MELTVKRKKHNEKLGKSKEICMTGIVNRQNSEFTGQLTKMVHEIILLTEEQIVQMPLKRQ